MSDSNISPPKGDLKPFSDKLTVTPELHKTTYRIFIKSLECTSIVKHLISAIPETQRSTTPKDEPNLGDTELLCGVLLERVAEISEFLDILHCTMKAQEVSQSENGGDSDHE